jgi:hypothetical protein
MQFRRSDSREVLMVQRESTGERGSMEKTGAGVCLSAEEVLSLLSRTIIIDVRGRDSG